MGGGLVALSSTPSAQAQVEVRATVLLKDALSFEPAVLSVNPGAEVTLTLVGGAELPHTFTLFAPANATLPLDSESGFQAYYANTELIVDVTVPFGQEVVINFTAPATTGVYNFACVIPGHAISGMVGVLSVGLAAAPGDGEGVEGVELRAYWIGIIGIFSMIGVIVAAYFVIKYESRHHTDHRDHKRRGLP